MTAPQRPTPPMNADERTTLASWLDFHRATLELKCVGLSDEQAATASVPPSGFSLIGLVQHLTEVERNWFRRVLAGEDVVRLYQPSQEGHDGGFDVAPGTTLESALQRWRSEVAVSRRNCAERDLADTGSLMGAEVNLRWIYVHMIEEYARHNGHADLVRERVDGATGF